MGGQRSSDTQSACGPQPTPDRNPDPPQKTSDGAAHPDPPPDPPHRAPPLLAPAWLCSRGFRHTCPPYSQEPREPPVRGAAETSEPVRSEVLDAVIPDWGPEVRRSHSDTPALRRRPWIGVELQLPAASAARHFRSARGASGHGEAGVGGHAWRRGLARRCRLWQPRWTCRLAMNTPSSWCCRAGSGPGGFPPHLIRSVSIPAPF